MAMMQQVILLEANKGNKHGHYGKGAERPIFPLCLKQDAVCAIMHESHNAHLHVAHGNVTEPGDGPMGRAPGDHT